MIALDGELVKIWQSALLVMSTTLPSDWKTSFTKTGPHHRYAPAQRGPPEQLPVAIDLVDGGQQFIGGQADRPHIQH